MALELKLQSVVENKIVNPDQTETITGYDVSVYITTDTAPNKTLANKTVGVAAGQSSAQAKTEFKDKIRSWWQKCLAEYNRKVNLRTVAQEGIDELITE